MHVAHYTTNDGGRIGLSYDEGVFSVRNHPVSIREVQDWDRRGLLVWVSPEMQQWARELQPAKVELPPVHASERTTSAPGWMMVAAVLAAASTLFGLCVFAGASMSDPSAGGSQPVKTGSADNPAPSPDTSAPSTIGNATVEEPTAAAQSSPEPESERASEPASEPDVVTEPATVVRVVDGDTAIFRLEDGTEEKTRFIGIDTPESTTEIEVYGKEASAFTASVLKAGAQVFLEQDVEQRDRYGRLLAYVWLTKPTAATDSEIRAKMFNAHLALQGYAQQMTIQPNSKYADYFTTYVAEARDAQRGLWNPGVIGQEGGPSPPPVATEPALTPSAMYIGNRNTKKFHYPDCASVGQMNPANKVPLASRDAAISQGYVPCKNCNP